MKRIKCDFCDNTYSKRTNMYRHIRRVHKEQKCKCNFCDKMFLPYFMKIHINRAHRIEGVKPFKCDFCDKTFTRNSSMQKHIKRFHEENEEQKIKCEFCDESISPAYLKKHISNVHEEANKGTCDLCGNEYKFLKVHIQKFHKKTHQCENCGKRFSLKRDLQNHNNNVQKG